MSPALSVFMAAFSGIAMCERPAAPKTGRAGLQDVVETFSREAVPRCEDVHMMTKVPRQDVRERPHRGGRTVRGSERGRNLPVRAREDGEVTVAQRSELVDEFGQRDTHERAVRDVFVLVEPRKRSLFPSADRE